MVQEPIIDQYFRNWKDVVKCFRSYETGEQADRSIYLTMPFWTATGKGRCLSLSYGLHFPFDIHETTLVQTRKDELLAVVPFLVNKKTKEIYLRGQYTAAGHLGAFYTGEWTYEAFMQGMASLGNRFAGYQLVLDRIYEDSLLASYAEQYCASGGQPVEKEACVAIPIQSGYEAWYSGLSRKSRYHVRVTYSRLEKEAAAWQLKPVFTKRDTNKDIFARSLFYSRRIFSKNNHDFGLATPVFQALHTISKLVLPMTKALKRLQEAFHMEVYINGEMAAFLSGFLIEGDRLVVPRLAIDLKYKHYNPGSLLISETIKYLSNELKDYNIKFLDLARGDEPYKLDHGGEVYYNLRFKMQLH